MFHGLHCLDIDLFVFVQILSDKSDQTGESFGSVHDLVDRHLTALIAETKIELLGSNRVSTMGSIDVLIDVRDGNGQIQSIGEDHSCDQRQEHTQRRIFKIGDLKLKRSERERKKESRHTSIGRNSTRHPI